MIQAPHSWGALIGGKMKKYINFGKWAISKVDWGYLLKVTAATFTFCAAVYFVLASIASTDPQTKKLYGNIASFLFGMIAVIGLIFPVMRYYWNRYNEEINQTFNILKNENSDKR